MLPASSSNQCFVPADPGRRWLALALALCVCLSSATSIAQSDADRATARALAAEGFEALQSGDYGVAEDRFRRADALVHAPTLVVDRGRALLGMKRYVEAQEQFELVLREGVDKASPQSWKKSLEEARALLDEVEPKIAWLTISVPGVSNAEITVDGQPVPRAALGVRRATDPGTRTIEVKAQGYAPRELTVELSEGSEESLQVELDPLPEQKKAVRPPPSRPVEPEPDKRTPRILMYAAFGVGGAGIAVGSVTGILALQKYSDLSKTCTGDRCPPSQQSKIDSYHRVSWTSGVGFGVGLAGAAAGLTLLLTQRGAGSEERVAQPKLQLYAGPGVAGLRGSF